METTSKATHTPGPWHIAGDAIYSGQQNDTGGWVNSEQVFPRYSEDPQSKLYQRSQANAQLIAAAPELLEALREAVELCDQKLAGSWCNRWAAAIAKAEGRDV